MSYNKIIGYVLLVIGLMIIGWSLYRSYTVFTGQAEAPLLFKEQTNNAIEANNQNAQSQVQNTLNKIIPPDAITKMFNLVSWSILAGVLTFGGSQIAAMGVRMIL